MKKNPDISVIVPHLNQAIYLDKCLASLSNQSISCVDVEIIVVDNGSSQLPLDIVRKYSNVRLEQEVTPGPGPARNTGIAVSKASLLAFIDADCLADKDWLRVIYSGLNAEPQRQVIGGDVRIALVDPKQLTTLEAYESIYAYRQQDYIERQGFSGTGNLAMRRSAYQAVGPFAGIDIAEDRDWGKRATSRGISIAYVPDMIVFHPARRHIRELYQKWDRHIAHDYEEQVSNSSDKLRWIAKAAALSVSPVWEVARIATSTRVWGWRARWLALLGLALVRLYRSRRMLGYMMKGSNNLAASKWNR